jgi:general secretion pathway protein L
VSLSDLLNSEIDVASLSASARRGLAWWLDELATLLPASWRESLSSRPSAWLEPAETGGWRLWRDGRASPAPPPGSVKGRVGLLTPEGLVLAREVHPPRMPALDVRRMLALDIDRLSPLSPELIHYDIDIVERAADGGRQTVLVGIIGRTDAADLVATARASGYWPVALSANLGAGTPPRFDFMPAVVEAAGGVTGDKVRRNWWIAVAALIVANLLALVGRDVLDVERLRKAVDAQRPGVEVVERLRGRVLAEDSRRRDLLARGLRGDPLRLLDILTGALPAGAFVQHLEWNGKAVRLVGYERGESDVGAAIKASGAFAAPRTLIGPPTAGATVFRPFDLTADARPAARP